MEIQEMLRRLDRILDNSRVGILTTVDEKGYPHSRWMTPTLVHGREGLVYAVTSPSFMKAAEIKKHPQVGWIFQTKALDEIISIKGRVNVIDNPALRSEVNEALGRDLAIFWRVNPTESELVVLETIIETMTLFRPLKNERFEVEVQNGENRENQRV